MPSDISIRGNVQTPRLEDTPTPRPRPLTSGYPPRHSSAESLPGGGPTPRPTTLTRDAQAASRPRVTINASAPAITGKKLPPGLDIMNPANSKWPEDAKVAKATAEESGDLIANAMNETWRGQTGLNEFATRVIKRLEIERTSVLIAMSYLDRIAPQIAEMKKTPSNTSPAPQPVLDGKIALLAILNLAYKCHHDKAYKNAVVAKEFKTHPDDLNKAERIALKLLDHNVAPPMPPESPTKEESIPDEFDWLGSMIS